MDALSRRSFGRLAGMGLIAAALPKVPLHAVETTPVSVRLSANENPYGPCAGALSAMNDAMRVACRYPDEAQRVLREAIARANGVPMGQVILGDGSSEILKLAAAAFTGPSRKLVVADPTFEVIGIHARAGGAEVVDVPLDASFGHDLAKMAAVAGAGLIYVCNPNNPTGSITGKQLVRSFLESVPPQTIVLVDEAYFHFADSPDYETVIPLVASRPNLLVTRTFSKVYGMAGVRCGYGIAQPSLIQQMRKQEAFDTMNIFALTGARASLLDPHVVAIGKRRNNETRRMVVSAIEKLGYDVIPSQANFIMVNTRRNVKPLIETLREQGVHVGREFPAMPRHLRVSIGKPEEMQVFLGAFQKVMV